MILPVQPELTALALMVNVAAVVLLLVRVPPELLKALLRAPTVKFLPLRSTVAPRLTFKAVCPGDNLAPSPIFSVPACTANPLV